MKPVPLDNADSGVIVLAMSSNESSARRLLDACFAEWTKSAPRDRNREQVEAEIARLGKHDPVEAYRAACRVLARKR